MDNFFDLMRAVDLLAREAPMALDRARGLISEIVRSGDVRLRDKAGAVTSYANTPEVAAWNAARTAPRPGVPRYNPNSYARSRGAGSSARPPAPRQPAPSDQILAAGYAGDLGEFEKVLARDHQINVGLVAAAALAAAPAAVLPADADLIDRLLEYLRINGPKSENQGIGIERWVKQAAEAGLSCSKIKFEAALVLAVKNGWVVRPPGRPTKDKQFDQRSAYSSSPQQERPAAQRKQVGGT